MLPLCEFLKHEFRSLILGMGFAGEDKLNGPLGVIDQPQQSLRIAQQQIPTLVTRDAPRETDRQIPGIEDVRAWAALVTHLGWAMTQRRHQAVFQETVSLPQFRIRDSFNTTRPRRRVTGFFT